MGLLQRVADFFYEPLPSAPIRKSARPAGTDGLYGYGGWLDNGESNTELSGPQRWLTYRNTINTPVVATGVRYFGNLLAGTKWHAEPNESGSSDAAKGVEIVTQGLLQAQMVKPWPLVVRKAAMYRMLGFSLHATGIKRRPDGMIVYSAIEHRPQHTIERWQRADNRSDWDSVEQRTEDGSVYPISLDECFYCVDDTLTDHPEGVGLLRHCVEYVRRLELFQALEGSAYQSDMGGMPLVWAPFAELATTARSLYPGDAAAQRAYVDANMSTIIGVVEKRIKTPEANMFLALDSATYAAADKGPSGLKKYGLELLASQTNGLTEVDTTIKRVEFQIARVLGIEFALVGAEGGSYSMHADKTSMFATTLAVTLSEMSAFATSQLARRLVRLNGLDPDTATPKLVAEPISTESVMNTALALQAMSNAALHPKDPARAVIRTRLALPPEPEVEGDGMAPRVPMPPGLDIDELDEDGDDPDADEIDDAEDVEEEAA